MDMDFIFIYGKGRRLRTSQRGDEARRRTLHRPADQSTEDDLRAVLLIPNSTPRRPT